MQTLQTVLRRSEGSPSIRSRYNASGWRIPMRVYYHTSGLEQAYKDPSVSIESEGLKHLQTIPPPQERAHEYLIAILWGNDDQKMVDLFGFSGLDIAEEPQVWPGNPDIDFYIFRNGIYQPQIKRICEDGAIILGIEGRHRRTRKSLKDYAENPPEIEGIEFSL